MRDFVVFLKDKEIKLGDSIPYDNITLGEVYEICMYSGIYAEFDGDSKRVRFWSD